MKRYFHQLFDKYGKIPYQNLMTKLDELSLKYTSYEIITILELGEKEYNKKGK